MTINLAHTLWDVSDVSFDHDCTFTFQKWPFCCAVISNFWNNIIYINVRATCIYLCMYVCMHACMHSLDIHSFIFIHIMDVCTSTHNMFLAIECTILFLDVWPSFSSKNWQVLFLDNSTMQTHCPDSNLTNRIIECATVANEDNKTIFSLVKCCCF